MRLAVEEWQRVDPSRRPAEWKIFERDEWRCRAPGCSSRRRLEAHHVIFRSHNGSDDPKNLVTLCHAHHRRGIHEGTLRVEGTAPHALRWRLGGGRRRWDGTPRPVRYFRGSHIVAHPGP
ncbi:MAG TPA: HNH endonuclease [Candidatus Eisenbacteria bacterium]|nr:HNH endonuclease [Candidatus Eisenbacteria bacterium]